MLAVMSDQSTAGPTPEDRKIVTLARSARARNAVPEGAAVRDETGRTYVAGSVALPSLRLSALRTAVAMAVASGATSLEAAAVVSEAAPGPGRGPGDRTRPGRTGHPGAARRPGRRGALDGTGGLSRRTAPRCRRRRPPGRDLGGRGRTGHQGQWSS